MGDGNIRAAATDVQADPGFAVNIVGQGTDRIGAIQVGRSAGTVMLDDESNPVYTYERIPWIEFEYTIYQGLAVQGDAWIVFWFYCQEGALKWVYHESTHGDPLRFESAQGSCGDVDQGPVRVQYPATNMTAPSFTSSHEISGANIHLDDGRGWLNSGGRRYALYAFQHVDCRSECGDDAWQEIHVVLYNETSQRAAFGIVYLYADEPNRVSFLYGLRLPLLTRMSDTFDASWSQ